MKAVPYEDLVARLAEPESLPPFTNPVVGISHTPPKGDDFLPATSTCAEPSATPPQVLLIGASAAVGKSRLAAALAADTGNPLWDLSKFKMGSNFFSGTIVEHYGGAGYDTIKEMLTASELTLVFDAVDEAFAAVGLESYGASIDNLANLIKPMKSSKPAAVIFGRPDTLIWTQTMLEQAGVSYERLQVSFFDEQQSIEFVKQKVRSLLKTNAPRTYDEVDTFVHKFRKDVSQALSGASGADIRDEFLGYAPVLDALATFAAGQHGAGKKLAELNASQHVRYAYSLLVEVVESICGREKDKLASIVKKPNLAAAVQEVYGTEAQVRLLLQPDAGSIDLPPGLPHEDAEHIRSTWELQFEEHPFRRGDLAQLRNPLLKFASVVFRDFCIARAFRTFDELELLDLFEQIDDHEFQASAMLVRFLSVAPEAERNMALPPDALGAVLDSVGAVQKDELQADVTLDAATIDRVAVDISDVYDFDSGPASLLFALESGRVDLARTLSNASVNVPELDVRIKAGRDFVLGRRAEIVARRLVCDVDEVRVTAGDEDDDVKARIEVDRLESKTARIHGLGLEYAKLDVFCPEPIAHPWRPYLNKDRPMHQPDSLIDVARELKKVTKWFIKPNALGWLTYYKRPMDSLLAKGMLDKDLFAYMLKIDMIIRIDESYRLVNSPPISAILNCDLSDDSLKNFIVDYLVKDTIR